MAVVLKLREYHWSGSEYVPGTTYNWQPLPKSVTKQVEITWRIRHRGRRKLKKAKYRVRETITYTLSGSLPDTNTAQSGDLDRKTLEWLVKRNSKFKILNPSELGADEELPDIFITPDPESGTQEPEDVFVVLKNVKFTGTEGKIGWYDYNITLERVNCYQISGYSDPWKCK